MRQTVCALGFGARADAFRNLSSVRSWLIFIKPKQAARKAEKESRKAEKESAERKEDGRMRGFTTVQRPRRD